MDRSADWRVIEPEHDPATPEADDEELSDEPAQAGPAAAALPRSGSAAQPAGRRTLVAAIAAAGAAAAIGLAVWTSVPQPELIIDAGASSTPEAVASMPATEQAVVIDVQGAVVEPGLHRLQPGMRVGDAIAAAGGYAPQVDLAAAAEVLNLAELLSDGA
ncbi:MAG TPA: SLBB domain-containing protein, partial [Candidatus Limnocylindria bacterium]|nr:SLBB domain-containing protein [Candidatus Limnocylindria bacterium]